MMCCLRPNVIWPAFNWFMISQWLKRTHLKSTSSCSCHHMNAGRTTIFCPFFFTQQDPVRTPCQRYEEILYFFLLPSFFTLQSINFSFYTCVSFWSWVCVRVSKTGCTNASNAVHNRCRREKVNEPRKGQETIDRTHFRPGQTWGRHTFWDSS